MNQTAEQLRSDLDRAEKRYQSLVHECQWRPNTAMIAVCSEIDRIQKQIAEMKGK